MAYGLNFFSEWADNEEAVYRTEILKRDYAGGVTQVTSGDNPFVLSLMDSASNNPFYPVRTKKAEIEWMSEETSGFDISDIFITDEQEYQVRFGTLNEETEEFTVLWSGYLVFTDCKEPYQAKPYPVQMSAACGLSLLHEQYVLDLNGRFIEGEISLFNIIVGCLSQTNLGLGIDVSVALLDDTGTTQVPLSQTYINADGLRGLYAFDALAGILDSINAMISQDGNKWVIRGIPEMDADSVQVHSFDASGNFLSFGTFLQISSFGRNTIGSGIVNLLPMSDIIESVAEPVSLITNEVSPGIPVNRLNNGTFNPNRTSWNVNLAGMTSWAHSPEPTGWRVEGDGKPDNPYRFVMVGSVKTTGDIVFDSNRNRDQKEVNISNSTPITIHSDAVNGEIPNVKIVVSGAFRARDGGRLMIACRLNDGDRDMVDWLDENGTWNHEEYRTIRQKATNRHAVKVTVDTPHDPSQFRELEDMPLQTFEVTSSKISNYLSRPGGWVAKLYFSVYPITVGANNFPGVSNNYSPAVWLEDFNVSITTETAYEAEHYYQIDSKKIIRNGEEYEYTSIIADKINILTSEQRLPSNRVMTGYTSVGISNLSKGWRRKVNGEFTGEVEPLQHLTLRERIRLLGGKRRILEGSFYGPAGVKTTNSVINQFDGGRCQITGWSWDVKNCIYNLRLHELDFTPLPEEIITLTNKRGESGRGNRMYQGASGSGASGNGSNGGETRPIILDTIPPLFFTVGKQEIKVVDFADLILSDHEPAELEADVIHYTDWVSHATVTRGTNGDKLDVEVTAWPTTPGTDRVLVELIGQDGEDYIAKIDIVALPAPRVDNTLLSIGTTITEIGEIPGMYELPENRWDWMAHIKSRHDEYELIITGGGDFGTAVNRTIRAQVLDSEDAQYRIFQELGGILTEAGVFTFTVNTYLRGELHYTESGDFVLYDEEFLAKVKFFLTKDNNSLGEISPHGVSEFVNPISWDPEVAIDDVEHDKITFILYNSTESIKTTVLELSDPETVGTYPLYGTDQELPAGAYKLEVILALGLDNVLKRYVNFVINEKEVEREGYGIKLIEAIPGKTDFKVLAELPLTGSSHVLPANGWGLLSDAETSAYDREEFEIFQLRGGALVEINTQPYTGAPQSIQYPTSQYETPYKFFGNKTSKDIDGIHATPSTFRAIATRWLGSKVVAKLSADFSFGPVVDIEEVPISDPGSKTADYVAGAGMSEETVDFIKRFNVNVDDATLEIFQSESPDDPDSPGLNQIQVKEGGILFEHLQDIPDMTVIGNLTGGGVPYAVTVADIMSEAEIGDLITAIAIKNYITEQLGDSEDWVTDNFVPLTRQILAGVGLTGGGALSIDRTITLGTPSTLNAGTTNAVTGTTHTHEITTADLIEGSNVVFSGSGVDRLIGSGPLTINVTQVPWGIVISRPTTLAGYGITDSLTTSNITSLLTGKEDVFSKGDLIEGSGISMSGVLTDRLVGPGNVTITCTVSGIGGSGTTGYIPKFTGSAAIGNSSIQDNGSYVTFNSEVSMNDDVQIFAQLYASRGVIGGAGAHPSAALTVNSTTQGIIVPRMTKAQRLAISTPGEALLVYQTDADGGSPIGFKFYFEGGVSGWYRLLSGGSPE